jgi:hypothetical protein
MNVDAPTDYSGTRMFADAIKQSRGWQKMSADQPAVLDTSGWPLEDARLAVWHGISRMNGTYRLSFKGQAEVKIGCCAGTIQNKIYSPSTNTTTADLVYPTTDGSGLFLEFRNTKRTASSPAQSGITNLKLMRPVTEGSTQTYPPATLFTTPYKETLKRFQVLRFMDFVATNSNAQKDWSERLTPHWYSMNQSAPGYGWQGRGGAYEYAIALCNELNADCWLIVPAQANDNYVRQLAELVKAQLNPNLKLYLEYSNELWNTGPSFQQGSQNYNLAKAEVNSGASPLNFDGNRNDWNWAWRRVAKRGAEISVIFRQVFGDAAMMTRIRPVLMSQLGYTDGPLLQAIHFLQGYYNNPAQVPNPKPPKYYFYGLGGSAYYNPLNPTSPNAVFADLSNTVKWAKALQQDAHYAAAFGLKRIAYEGGPSLEGGNLTNTSRPSYRNDPRIKNGMIQAHDRWSANGGDLLVYFTLTGESPWGFVPDIWDAANPQKNLKLQAIDSLNQRPRAKVTLGIPLPATWAASQSSVPPGWIDNRRVDQLKPGQWFSYTTRTDTPGRFNISLKASARETNGQVEIWVDGGLLGVVNIPSTSWLGGAPETQALPMPLGEGLHGIMIRPRSGTVNVSQIIVNRASR